MSKTRNCIRLIVNADDYGYFACTSQGILAAASAGKLTATGILANSPDLNRHLDWLDQHSGLDFGVHLNLSCRQPLTTRLAAELTRFHGAFPSVSVMSLLILSKKISLSIIKSEWRAQIEACRGRKLRFLNSHEHIHMLPALFPVVLELAAEFRIPYVRLTQADWMPPLTAKACMRNILIQSMHSINRHQIKVQSPLFLGLGNSGKLNLDYLSRLFASLQPGKTYELMCHPGYFDETEISESKLIAYHAWEQELALLLSPELQELYEKYGIRLQHYRN